MGWQGGNAKNKIVSFPTQVICPPVSTLKGTGGNNMVADNYYPTARMVVGHRSSLQISLDAPAWGWAGIASLTPHLFI